MLRNRYHRMCTLCTNCFPPIMDIPSFYTEHCQPGISGLTGPGSGKTWSSRGRWHKPPSTYTGGSWLLHSSVETWKWGAKWAASCSASLEAWDRNTQKHSLAILQTLITSVLLAVTKELSGCRAFPRLRKPAPVAVSNSLAA